MTMNKKKAARRRGDAGHRFSVARVPALLATALGALALPAWAQDAGQAGDTAQTQDEAVQLPQVRVRALRLFEVQPPNMSLPGSGVTDSGKISRRRATTPAPMSAAVSASAVGLALHGARRRPGNRRPSCCRRR